MPYKTKITEKWFITKQERPLRQTQMWKLCSIHLDLLTTNPNELIVYQHNGTWKAHIKQHLSIKEYLIHSSMAPSHSAINRRCCTKPSRTNPPLKGEARLQGERDILSIMHHHPWPSRWGTLRQNIGYPTLQLFEFHTNTYDRAFKLYTVIYISLFVGCLYLIFKIPNFPISLSLPALSPVIVKSNQYYGPAQAGMENMSPAICSVLPE